MISQVRTKWTPVGLSGPSQGSGHVLQRKCACGGSASFSGECEACKSKKPLEKPLQARWRINEPGDQYEQEADRVAEQVMRMPDAGVTKQHRDTETPLVQRQATGGATGVVEAPPSVHNVLNAPGQPLDTETRAFFEPRFGHDFGQVRVHADAMAEQSARDVNAHAYTVGHDIVFGAGQSSSGTSEGRRLLAHELTHVIQQGQGVVLQRQPTKRKTDQADTTPKVRKDVIVVLSSVKNTPLGKEASALAPGVKPLRADSPQALAAVLKSVKEPIGTLYLVGHAIPSGDLAFDTEDSLEFELPSTVAKALKGAIKPEFAPLTVDFRSCSIGQSPTAMDEIRASVGAGAALGGTCSMVVLDGGPVKLDGKAITRPSQVTDANRADFEKGFKAQIAAFKDSKACLIDSSQEGYFRSSGKLFAVWFSPEEVGTTFDSRKSVCYSTLKPQLVDPAKLKEGDLDPGVQGECRLIRVEAKKKP